MPNFIGDTTSYPIVAPAAADRVPLVQGGALKQATVASLLGVGGLPCFRYAFDGSATSAADPGAGLIRYNNATQASATALYVDNVASDGTSLATFFGTLTAGWVSFVKLNDPDVWQLFRFTAIADSTGYRTLTVTNQASAGSFDNADVMLVTFMVGATGAVDSDDVTYTPTTLADWDGGTDPGDVEQALDQLAERVADIEGGTFAATTQADEMMAGFIGTVADKDYRIVVKAAHGGTITETTTRSESGTATFTFKINTTALGGTANSVSSSEQSQSHASSNAFSAGDDIVITASSNSSCLGASFSIKYTRTLS